MDLDDQDRVLKKFSCPACSRPIDFSASTYTSTMAVSGRGTLIFTLGILSILVLGPILGIPAWVMGSGDLKKIRMGMISATGKGLTKAGMILGIIGTFLLPIIVSAIVFIVAIPVGITMYSDSAINADRDALANDLVNLASRAQQYYARPASLGGGGQSFNSLTSITLLTNKPQNSNGTYWIVSNKGGDGPVVIGGRGLEVYNGRPVEVHIVVSPTEDRVVMVN